jgi:AraC family transcriptional regulator
MRREALAISAESAAHSRAQHFHRHVDGLGLYYHASPRREGLKRHAHEEVQISIPLRKGRGAASAICDRIDVIPGFEEHSTDWGGAEEVIVLHFGRPFFDQALEEPIALAERGARRAKTDPFVARIGQVLREELRHHGSIDAFHLSSIGTLLAGYLFKSGEWESDGPEPAAPRIPYAKAWRAIEMMNVGGESVSLSDISAELGLSQWHFSRQFRRTTGLSPYQFLIRSRIERARSLLESGRSIAEVAALIGFCDQSHMHRHFKRIFGVTPASIRPGRGRREA